MIRWDLLTLCNQISKAPGQCLSCVNLGMLIVWCGVFWSITCFELFQNLFWTLYLILKRKCVFNGLFLMETLWLCYSEMRFYFWTCLILVSRNEENPTLASITSVQSIFSPLEVSQLLPFALAEFAQLTSTKLMSWLTIPPPASLHAPACWLHCAVQTASMLF